MSNYQHRTSQHQRYSLRGNRVHADSTLQLNDAQETKNKAARRVGSTWPISRVSKQSRGLNRSGNTCYRMGGIQTLMHLPKFLNWILSHNVVQPNGQVKFQCRSPQDTMEEMKKSLMLNADDAFTQTQKRPRPLRTCPACVTKQLVQSYWGNNDLASDGRPMAFGVSQTDMARIHELDDILQHYTPGASNGSMQDPEEFQNRLLEACLQSVDHNASASRAWRTRYEALFLLELKVRWHYECGHRVLPLPIGTNGPESIGFANIPVNKHDTLEEAIRGHFVPELLSGVDQCPDCDSYWQRTKTIRIRAAPDILRIKLSSYNNKRPRNNNLIQIPEFFDLTQYQAVPNNPTPLEYRLSSVMLHGSLHWTATVLGPHHVYAINDGNVQQRSKRRLNDNPQSGRTVYVLMYTRVQSKSRLVAEILSLQS